MKEIIKFLSTDSGIQIIGFLVTIFVAYITARYASKNSKKSLVTQYFKEKGVVVQENVLRFWCTLFLNSFNIQKAYRKTFDKEGKNNFTRCARRQLHLLFCKDDKSYHVLQSVYI